MAQNLGRYILERTLAVGGMGEVFHARQTGPDGFDRTCVVKTMHANLAQEPDMVELFLEEARLTARLTHPHIAQVYDFGKIDSAYYIAMELVDGHSLHTVAKAYATRSMLMPLGPVLRIVSQAAQALDYVHRLKAADGAPLNLIHRDISPGNLLLSRDGLVKLIDFGIAKARTTARQTAMGQIRGKLAYMSPEQMVGAPLDGRTDIYSLGLVLYELLSGRRANPGRNEVEILASVKTATLAPVQAVRPDAPATLGRVLERATARNRDLRYARAGELSQALEQVLIEAGQAIGPEQLSAVAEEVELHPPRPSPGFAKASIPHPGAPTRAANRAAPPAAPTAFDAPARGGAPTSVDLPQAPPPVPAARPPASNRGTWLAAGAALVLVLGAAGGAVWAALAGDEPVARPMVVAPPPVPPPAKTPAIAPAPEREAEGPAEVPEPDGKPARWVKAEKFERRGAEKEPQALPKPRPTPTPPAQAQAPPTTGAVKVISDPPTEVFVDGAAAGVTPTTLQLAPGPHHIELKEPRLHLTWSRAVDAIAGGSETLQWRATHGTIDVRPVPPHVELQISIDGVAVGHTPISAFSVWEGTRTISALNTATGWHTEQRIEVPAGGRVRIKVNDGAGMELSPSR